MKKIQRNQTLIFSGEIKGHEIKKANGGLIVDDNGITTLTTLHYESISNDKLIAQDGKRNLYSDQDKKDIDSISGVLENYFFYLECESYSAMDFNINSISRSAKYGNFKYGLFWQKKFEGKIELNGFDSFRFKIDYLNVFIYDSNIKYELQMTEEEKYQKITFDYDFNSRMNKTISLKDYSVNIKSGLEMKNLLKPLQLKNNGTKIEFMESFFLNINKHNSQITIDEIKDLSYYLTTFFSFCLQVDICSREFITKTDNIDFELIFPLYSGSKNTIIDQDDVLLYYSDFDDINNSIDNWIDGWKKGYKDLFNSSVALILYPKLPFKDKIINIFIGIENYINKENIRSAPNIVDGKDTNNNITKKFEEAIRQSTFLSGIGLDPRTAVRIRNTIMHSNKDTYTGHEWGKALHDIQIIQKYLIMKVIGIKEDIIEIKLKNLVSQHSIPRY